MKIYEFQRNALEKVVIELSDYNSEKYINVRIWFDPGDSSGKYRPSPKGLTLNVKLIEKLKKGVDMAAAYLEKAKEK